MQKLGFGVIADDAGAVQALKAQLSLIGEGVVDPEQADAVFYLGGNLQPERLRGVLLVTESATAVLKAAALTTVSEPLSLSTLQHTVAQCYRQQREQSSKTGDNAEPQEIVGDSAAARRIRQQLRQVARTDSTVLLTGPSGTGKSFIAEVLHRHSPRSGGAFVPVNCGAIPADLMESELFGHERGAFTGAIERKIGRFELAAGGALFLDEIGELPGPLQVKLLRALQERQFERVGGMETFTADVRVVAATNADLEALIAERRFREDLFYRLNVFPIAVPSLAERKEDMGALVAALRDDLIRQMGSAVRLTEAALERLSAYSWPGNLRELRNLLERLYVEFGDVMLDDSDLPERLLQPSAPEEQVAIKAAGTGASAQLPINGLDLKSYLSDLEQQLIEQALRDSDSVVARAADRLQIRRTTLVEKMRKYGIERLS
ncbi:MAG: sigma-54 dependent transcriptional regulator [Pseudomonadota bacterium]